MTLETIPWADKRPTCEPDKGGRPPAQRCEHQDCFTCPYDDCIIDGRELLRREREERKRGGYRRK